MAFEDGITAAANGVITGSVVVIAKRCIVDVPTAALALVTLAVLRGFKDLQEPYLILAAALFGLLVYPVVHRSQYAQLGPTRSDRVKVRLQVSAAQ